MVRVSRKFSELCIASYYPYKRSHTANFSFKGFICKHAYKERAEREKRKREREEEGRDTSGFARFDFFPCCARDVLRSSHGFSARGGERRRRFRRDVNEIITRGRAGKFSGT